MAGESPRSANAPAGAVFLSYASEDVAAAERIAAALRAAGIEVWFDKSELRGGDAWDRQIREQIHDCRLFIPVISANSERRDEGYFRREWSLAADRTRDMAHKRAFLVPVVIDGTAERGASVPEKFHDLQWTRLPEGATPTAFVARVAALLGAPGPVALANSPGPAPVTAPPGGARNRRVVWILLGLAALAIVIGGGWFVLRHPGLYGHAEGDAVHQSQPAASEKSIAVLPFVDLSEKHDQEYFGDGMAEEIINLLVKIPDLKVIGRTSSFQFKGKTDDLRKIGAALGSAYIVEGSVRRSDDHVRVTAQLIDTRDGAHRWSETYDRNVTDALAVQDEIAASLVRALQLEVAPSTYLMSRAPPRNKEAYEAYLRGLHAVDRNNESSLNEAVGDFRHALEIDPSFVPAAEALAWALFSLADTQYALPGIGYEHTRAAAEAALKLDPKSAQAHAVLCLVHIEYDWDWTAAELEAGAASGLAPNNPGVLTCATENAIAMGRWAEALGFADAAIAAEPLRGDIHRLRGYSYLRLGRYSDAERAFRREVEIAPATVWGHYFVAMALWAGGNAGAALDELQNEPDASGRNGGLVVIYQTLHRLKDAETAFARLQAESSERWPFGLAFACSARGQTDQAFVWLEKAYAAKDPSLWAIKRHPYIRNLERDPRYKAFLRKMNLPE
jgi:TolB-like protein